jgi:hypothetical protein
MFHSRNMVVHDAIEVVRRHLSDLPRSERREQLDAKLRDCAREAEQWSVAPPIRRELDGLMARLLALHLEVKRLEQHAGLVEDEVAAV